MKDWKCPCCSTTRESDDKKIIYFCPSCTEMMEEVCVEGEGTRFIRSGVGADNKEASEGNE